MQDYTKTPSPKRHAPVPRDELSLDHPPYGIKMERTLDGGTAIKIRVFDVSNVVVYFLAVLIACGLVFMVFFLEEKIEMYVWLILSPFIALALYVVWMTILHTFGRHEIRLGMGEGSVFTGIGPFGRTRRFSLQSIKTVKVHVSTCYDDNGNEGTYYPQICFELNNGKKIKLLNLCKAHQAWLWFALKNLGAIPKSINPDIPKFTTPEPP